MRTKLPLVMVGFCGAFVSGMWAAETATKPGAPAPSSAAEAVAAKPSTPATPSSAQSDARKHAEVPPALTPAKNTSPAPAANKAIEEANEDHVRPVAERFIMETPPPALRAEKKPPLPAPGMVWVPGHWTPVKGEWQWTVGHWGVPATPISVWIDAKYDPKTKQWSPGYWQPDRVEPHQPVPEEKEELPRAKFF